MEKKTDLRIIKTYKALTEALTELLKEKTMNEITVNEICEKAMIRRTTFYKHFGDKYELFMYVMKEIQMDITAKTEQMRLSSNDASYLFDSIVLVFDYIEANESIFHSFRDSYSSTVILNFLINTTAAELKEYLKKTESTGTVLPASPELMCQLLTGAFLQSASWWLDNRDRVTKYEIAEQLKNFMLNAIGLHSEYAGFSCGAQNQS